MRAKEKRRMMAALDNVNAQQFVQQTRESGGATMNLRSGKMLKPGRKAYVVGGETDRAGERIPTQSVPASEFSEQHVHDAVSSLLEKTGGKGKVNLGSWESNGNIELDASRSVSRPGEAIRKGKNRGEQAIWDNKHGKEISTR